MKQVHRRSVLRSVTLIACTLANVATVGCAVLSLAPRPTDAPASSDSVHHVAARYVGRALALRQSHFYGELYDDNERLLASPYAFASLFHRVDLYGEPIHPGPAHGILAAGTVVHVEAVEFPGPLSFLQRMPTAPAGHTWVRLRVGALEATRVHGENAPHRPLVVVLDGPADTPERLEAALAQLLAPPDEVAAWLTQLRPRVRAAVVHKQVMRGMRQGELLASQGEPWRWFDEPARDGRPAKVAWYPTHEAVLVQDVVVDVRRARPAPR